MHTAVSVIPVVLLVPAVPVIPPVVDVGRAASCSDEQEGYRGKAH
jgi:hypothetical protein